jgi:hypothetical protein
MLKDDRIVNRYSETFKLKILSELESGKYIKNKIRKIKDIIVSRIFYRIKSIAK